MGNALDGRRTATTELYVDSIVKHLTGVLLLVLGIVSLVVVLILRTPKSSENPEIIFSILVIFQAASVLITLLVWYWYFGQDLSNHINEIIHHVNTLTNQYKRYTDNIGRLGAVIRQVNETSLHDDLDNFLEHFVYVLTLKSRTFFLRHLIKWAVIFSLCLVWFIGLIIVASLGKFFADFLFLQIVCPLTLVILIASMIVVAVHVAYDLCQKRSYRDTFFYRGVPGCMDARLACIVQGTDNPRYLWLLSRHCWQNADLCSNPGLSKSLARRYRYMSPNNRGVRWRDQHFPTLRSDQVERFQYSIETYAEAKNQDLEFGCCESILWCGLEKFPLPSESGFLDLPVGDKEKTKPVNGFWKNINNRTRVGNLNTSSANTSDHHNSGSRFAFHQSAPESYMTPNLFARKVAKEAQTPEQLLDEKDPSRRSKPLKQRKYTQHFAKDDSQLADGDDQKRSRQSSHVSPLGLSRDDTEINYGALYHPHHLDPGRMQRNYDPLTYGVRMSIKKELAKESKEWR